MIKGATGSNLLGPTLGSLAVIPKAWVWGKPAAASELT